MSNNATTKNTLKQTKHQTKSQLVYKLLGHVTQTAGIEVFDPHVAGTRRLVKDRFRKSGSIQQRCLTKLASGDSLCHGAWDEV